MCYDTMSRDMCSDCGKMADMSDGQSFCKICLQMHQKAKFQRKKF